MARPYPVAGFRYQGTYINKQVTQLLDTFSLYPFWLKLMPLIPKHPVDRELMGKNRAKRGGGTNKTKTHTRTIWTRAERQTKLDISRELVGQLEAERVSGQTEAGNSETDTTKHRGKDTLVEVDTRFLQ